MKLRVILSILLGTVFCAQAYAEELPGEVQKMLGDLGPPDVQQQNNGRLFQCVHGGTKRVTVSLIGDANIFTADYNNCREPGSTRDGHYEVMIRDNEIIGRSSKRSINGDLFDAARDNNVTKVRDLIKRKADVNYTESISERISPDELGYIDEWTPLMWAAFNGNVDIVKLLVKAGVWVNYLNSNVVSALWVAAGNGHLGVVKILAQNGAYINNRNSEDVTPLMVAAMHGHYKVVQYLINARADMNLVHKNNEGDSALMFALARRHTAIARLLIDSGADVNVRNRFGVTALMIAAAEGNGEITGKLLDKKADITVKTDKGLTALDIAIGKGFLNIAELIKKAQAYQ